MIVESAPAKINLALHVRARRTDGYHEIETLFAFLRHGDELRVEPAETDHFDVIGPFAKALSHGDNLVLSAHDAFVDAFGKAPPISVRLDKRLPIASGIGGGSADAAAMLRVLARMKDVAVDDPRLVACAVALGADVPACLLGRSASAVGIGERLTPVDGLAGVPVLLVNPSVAVSTGAVFRGWDGVDRGPLAEGSLLDRARASRNDLEAPARHIAPVIDHALAELHAANDVLLARMSGSGATCFALFDSGAARDAASAAIAGRHPDWWRLDSTLD